MSSEPKYEDDIVTVTRVLKYVGPRSWVKTTLENSEVKGKYILPNGAYIEETSVTDIVFVRTVYDKSDIDQSAK